MKRELNPVSALSTRVGRALLLGAVVFGAPLLGGAACADADPADGARTDSLGGTDPSSTAPESTDMVVAPAPAEGTASAPVAQPGPAAVPPAATDGAAVVPPPAPMATPGPAVDPGQAIDPNQGVTPTEPAPVSMPVEPTPVEPMPMPVEPTSAPAPTPAPVATMDPVAPAPAGGELLPDQCMGIKKDMMCAAAGTCSDLLCGLADTGTRTCTCATTWSCTSCAFPMGADQPSILVPPTADNPLTPCDTTVVIEEEVCSVMGERCSLGEEVCACWATNSDGLPIWDCDSAPSFW